MAISKQFTKDDGTIGSYWEIDAMSIQDNRVIVAIKLYIDLQAKLDGKKPMAIIPIDLPGISLGSDQFPVLSSALEQYLISNNDMFLGGTQL